MAAEVRCNREWKGPSAWGLSGRGGQGIGGEERKGGKGTNKHNKVDFERWI